MVNKKLLINLISLTGVTIVGSTIAIGYVTNKVNNRFQDYGRPPVTSSDIDLMQAYVAASVGGSKLLYLSSFTHSSPLNKVLNISEKNNSFIFNNLGKMGFLLIDDQYGSPFFNENKLFDLTRPQPIWSTNVASAQFRVDLGSFITGIAAGQFLNEHIEYFAPNRNDANADSHKKELTWGTYGGAEYSSVTSFMGGFQRGIEWFNKNVVPHSNGKFMELKQILLKDHFSHGFNPENARPIVGAFLEENVDLLFPIAGPQIIEVARLVKQFNKRTVVLGVDTAVEKDTNADISLPVIPDGNPIGGTNKIIQFSSVKNINVLARQITKLINDPDLDVSNNPEFENMGGIGYSSLGDVNNNGAGVSEAGEDYFERAMKIFADANQLQLDITDPLTAYKNSTTLLSNQQTFKDLDKPENKYYLDPKKWNYSDIANSGTQMFPLTGNQEEISAWYDKFANGDETFIKNKEENMKLFNKWIELNKTGIESRKNTKTNLKGQFVKENWEKNKSIIKIIFQSPTSILFDKSFLESCYIGLYQYWESKGVAIPKPPGYND